MEKNLTPLLVVAAAITRKDGAVLLHCRPPGSDHAGLWEFPGGKVERGESPRAALVREITEECGLTLDLGALHPAGFACGPASDGASRDIVLLLFRTSSYAGTPKPLEGGQWDWFSSAEALQLAMPPLDRDLRRALIPSKDVAPEERGLPTP